MFGKKNSIRIVCIVVFLATLSIPNVGFSKYELYKSVGDGIELYKQPSKPDYILVIDLTKANIYSDFGDKTIMDNRTVDGVTDKDAASFGGENPYYKGQSLKDFRLPNGDVPLVISSGMFGGRYSYSPFGGNITFPLRAQGSIETEGYAGLYVENGQWQGGDWKGGSDPKNYCVLCIDNIQGRADILTIVGPGKYDYYNIKTQQKQNCPDEFVSFNKNVSPSATYMQRTFVGVASEMNDPVYEKVLFFKTSSQVLAEYGEKQIYDFIAEKGWYGADIPTIQFDGSGSTQLWLNGSYEIVGDRRLLWHAFVVVSKCRKFPDVQRSEWYCSYIERLYQAGVLHGYPDGYYRPAQNVNGVEFLKMVLQAIYGKEGVGVDFAEPVTATWYTTYTDFAVNILGLDISEILQNPEIKRYDAARLSVDAAAKLYDANVINKLIQNRVKYDLSDEEITTLTKTGIKDADPQKVGYTYLQLPKTQPISDQFFDVDWATYKNTCYFQIYACKKQGILEGYQQHGSGGFFGPTNILNRAELAAIICRIKFGDTACSKGTCAKTCCDQQ